MEDSPTQTPVRPEAPDSSQALQEAQLHRQKAQEAIDLARRNIAQGTAVHTSSHGVVETPRESAAIANGETDALK